MDQIDHQAAVMVQMAIIAQERRQNVAIMVVCRVTPFCF